MSLALSSLEPVIRMSHENMTVNFQKLQICPHKKANLNWSFMIGRFFMIWKGCVLIIVRVESYERFDWLMGLWGKFAMSTEKFSGLIIISGSTFVKNYLNSISKREKASYRDCVCYEMSSWLYVWKFYIPFNDNVWLAMRWFYDTGKSTS